MPQTNEDYCFWKEDVWRRFGEAIGSFVSHPNYYSGRWFVEFRGGRRICSNYRTAIAWCKYLRRNTPDGWTAVIGRADPLPGFPVTIS